MTQHIDEQRFVTVAAADIYYQIYLTSPDQDYIQKHLASKGVPYELSMLSDMKNRLSKDSTVIDIGANIGNHTFFLSNVVGCRVIAFEANAELAHAMDITANESGLEDKITVHAFALGEKPGFAEFEQSVPENLGAQSLRIGSGNIKIRTLDSFGITSPVTAIKLDVEGMELDVLKGGRKLIEKDLPILYVESQTKENFAEIASYLTQMGYCYRDTFNATPTHLFIHKAKIKSEEQNEAPILTRVENEYDLLADNRKIKTALVECQLKYREMCQLNSDIKKENTQLQQKLQANISKIESMGPSRFQADLDEMRNKCAAAEQLSERLKKELAIERSEKDFLLQQVSQNTVTNKLDAALVEKMTSEVERLVAENRSQKALLSGQQSLEFALQDCKKKTADISFVLENTKAEVLQLQSDKDKLTIALKEKEANEIELRKLCDEAAQQRSNEEVLRSDVKTQLAQIEQLTQENAAQALVMQSQADQIVSLETLKEELSVKRSRLEQLSVEKSNLQSENEELRSSLERSQIESIRVKELEQMLDNTASEKQSLEGDIAKLSLELEASLAKTDTVEILRETVTHLEKERAVNDNSIETLRAEHKKYILSLRSIYEQQLRDNEQQMQLLVEKKIESLAPLQANQEKLVRLVDYRNEIEKMYAERTPLLTGFPTNLDMEEIHAKKTAVERLNQELAEFNKQYGFPALD